MIPPSDRKLIVLMTIGLEVADAAAAVDKVINLPAAHGGQLYNSSLGLTTPEFAAGDLVFKLPPAEVDAFRVASSQPSAAAPAYKAPPTMSPPRLPISTPRS